MLAKQKSLHNTSNLHNLKNTLLHLVNVVDSIIDENQPEEEPISENNLVQSIHNLEHSVDHLCKVVQLLVPSNTIISRRPSPKKEDKKNRSQAGNGKEA